MQEEEENADYLREQSSIDELCEHDFSSSMRQSTMSEEQVCQTVQILHLNVCSRQHVRLLIILNEAHSDICLFDRHFIRLLRYYAYHVA